MLADSLCHRQPSAGLSAARIKTPAAALGDIGTVLHHADPTAIRQLYEALDCDLIYHLGRKTIEISHCSPG